MGKTSVYRGRRVPDFVIVGAMKAGTTSLHHYLTAHGDISIPDPELYLFDVDDPACHPRMHRGMISDGPQSYVEDFDELFNVYAAHFSGYSSDVLVGEDSTTYMYCRAAPVRMSEVLGSTRVVMMLRDPAARTLSQYWHEVDRRVMTRSLDAALLSQPTLLQRSVYVPGLREFRNVLGAEHVHVVLMEDLAARPSETVNSVREFLGLGPVNVPERQVSNKGVYPSRAWPLLARNCIIPHTRVTRTSSADASSQSPSLVRRAKKCTLVASSRILGGRRREVSDVTTATMSYLSSVLSAANEGLDELVGRDLTAVWPSWKGTSGDARGLGGAAK